MCNRWFRYALLLVLGVTLGFSSGQAKAEPWDVSGNTFPTNPLPTGPYQRDGSGFYTGIEFLMMHQSRAIGNQTIAIRGYVPSFDFPAAGYAAGQFRGSGAVALTSGELGNTSWSPGWRLTLGHRFEDGTSISLAWSHLTETNYSGGAGPQGFDFFNLNGGDNSFLFSPVYNFSTSFAGAPNRVITTQVVGGAVVTRPISGLLNGIWNGASDMTIKFSQRFDNWDLAARMPVFETENARSYAIAGGRFAWIFERFEWRTSSVNFIGDETIGFTAEENPQYAARYSNTLSQRMYGPMLGGGHEVYLGSGFGLGVESTFAPLVNITKERVKYIREDEATQAKRGWDDNTITFNANVALNLTWQPIDGLTFRFGWNAMNFFNTYYMKAPVGFNVGAIDPTYSTRVYRLIHGCNFGLAYTW